MTKWYEQRYVSHRDWILDNIDVLGLDDSELVMVLLIDFMNEHEMEIKEDILAQKLNKDEQEIQRVLSRLTAKKYLDILARGAETRWVLNGLFETDVARAMHVMDRSLVDIFEKEFGRPLSESEMEKINDWARTLDKRMIILALREASAYQSLSIPYIEKILLKWKNKGYTGKTIEREIRKW